MDLRIGLRWHSLRVILFPVLGSSRVTFSITNRSEQAVQSLSFGKQEMQLGTREEQGMQDLRSKAMKKSFLQLSQVSPLCFSQLSMVKIVEVNVRRRVIASRSNFGSGFFGVYLVLVICMMYGIYLRVCGDISKSFFLEFFFCFF